MSYVTSKVQDLSIGHLAERSGVAPSALRFYERMGLIHSHRTAGNQRRYHRDVLRRVAFIRTSQRVGISLERIRAALDLLPGNRTPNREDWARVSECWREDLNSRIRQLKELRDHLTDCIGCGCLSLERCRLANFNDLAAEEGPGPRRRLNQQTDDR